ncbi:MULTISPECIES: hypothetical protein [unclassified Sphingobium]|uniref:hypothetical protein n=1 Tax=unclassified Sphingobium TaxID=2611147 RepID=UPI0035A6499C
MTGDPAADRMVCRTDAEWAAVREARRAVNVAWVSTLINALVIIVAVGAPFLQQFVNGQEQAALHFAIKKQMMDDIREALKVADAEQPVEVDLAGPADERASPEIVALARLHLQQMARESRMEADEINRQYQLDRDDFDLWRLVGEMKEVYTELGSEAESADALLSVLPFTTNAVVKEKIEGTVDSAIDQLRDLRLIYQLNVNPDGSVKPSRVIFASCKDDSHKAGCAKPIGLWGRKVIK